MNSFGLIIQRTTSGLNDVFVSDNLIGIRKLLEIEKTTDDENKFATKLANQSVVYSVQFTTNYRVSSMIITDITDSFGRSGFYAIRLYFPKKYNFFNFEVILQKINKKYIEHVSNGTMITNQEFDEILKNDVPLEVSQQNFITVATNNEAFCFYNPSNPQFNNIFNSKNIGLYNKVYAFNQEKAVTSDLIKSLGLKSLEETKNNLKEVTIYNNYRILKELQVNNNPVNFSTSDSEIKLILNKEDVIEYNTTDNPKFNQTTDTIINVERKYIAPQQPRSSETHNFLRDNGMYFVMLLMIVVLGTGTWYLFFRNDTTTIDEEKETTTENTQPTSDTLKPDTSKIEFFVDSTESGGQVFKTNFSKLEKYRFRLDNKDWTYKNTKGKNTYVIFQKKTLDEIIQADNLRLNDNEKNDFFNNLESIGKQKILENEAKSNTSNETENQPKKNNNNPSSKKDKQKQDSQKPTPETKTEEQKQKEKNSDRI